MDNTTLHTFKRFAGINNVDETYRLPIGKDVIGNVYTDMAVLQNVDISNQYGLSTRPGSILRLSGTDIHSIWSSGGTCLFVDGDCLYRLTNSFTSELLMSGLVRGLPMSYASVNNYVYFTNGSYIGVYDSAGIMGIPAPTTTYKLPLPAGKFILYYRGCLYVAKGNVLYISDALCSHYDVRTGYRAFEGDITMLTAVDNGMYIADGKTWFIAGAGPDEFHKRLVSDEDAIPYTAVNTQGSDTGEGILGNVVVWTSTDGICYGNNSGEVRFISQQRYTMPVSAIGGAEIRKVNGQIHYIVTLY